MMESSLDCISDAVQMLSNFIGDLEIDEVSGAVKIRERQLARFLGVSHTAIQKLKTSLLRGNPNSSIELAALSQSGFHLATQDNPWINDYQIAWLCQYYSHGGSSKSRLKEEVVSHNQRLLAAFSAVGVRTIGYRAKGVNLDYTPTAKPVRSIQPNEIQAKGKNPITGNEQVKAALVHLGLDYYYQVKIKNVVSIAHSSFQVLDFYLPNVAGSGLAIKLYHQHGGGSGYEKIISFKDEILYCYPCPAIMVVSGDFMINPKKAGAHVIRHLQSFVNLNGKLREVISGNLDDLQNLVQSSLYHHVGKDYRGDRYKKIHGSGKRLMAG